MLVSEFWTLDSNFYSRSILPYKSISTEDGYHGHLYTSVGQYL